MRTTGQDRRVCWAGSDTPSVHLCALWAKLPPTCFFSVSDGISGGQSQPGVVLWLVRGTVSRTPGLEKLAY